MLSLLSLLALWGTLTTVQGAGPLCTKCKNARDDEYSCNNQLGMGDHTVQCGGREVCTTKVRCDKRGRLAFTKGCTKRGKISGLEEIFCNDGETSCSWHCDGTLCNENAPAELWEGLACYPVDEAAECPSFPCLIFSDNFDTLDFSKWQHEITAGGGGNWEFQYYTNNRSNSYVRDGLLYILPTLTDDSFYPGFVSSGNLELWGTQPPNLCTGNQWWGCQRAGNPTNYINPVQSASLRSVNGFNFRYGRVEVQAQMPEGDWLWPAIWMLPTYNEYGDWPASGEIDIAKSRGNSDLRDENGVQKGNELAGSALHWGPNPNYNRWYMTVGEATGNFADEMHLYAMEWDDSHIQFEIDGEVVLNVSPVTNFWDMGGFPGGMMNPWAAGSKMAPFDAKFYLKMNVAVGGTLGYFPDGWTNAGYQKPWVNTSPTGPKDFWLAKDDWYPTWNGENAALKVDYIKVYKMKDD